jgi:hypothetical protein
MPKCAKNGIFFFQAALSEDQVIGKCSKLELGHEGPLCCSGVHESPPLVTPKVIFPYLEVE